LGFCDLTTHLEILINDSVQHLQTITTVLLSVMTKIRTAHFMFPAVWTSVTDCSSQV